ncbi:MAG TPA: class I SAM-dependent methyltransferase [Acidobacteriaceae bacterium]|nr:class I SAM-dependent methyltransferase [Acidobacteriaceae bacterium]
MNPIRPSRTALRVALRRAAHQIFDLPPLVFEDPIAMRILGPHAAEVERTPGRISNRKPRPHSAAMRALIVARSRYAEDLLARAVRTGVRQYVLLGAGLDTFAHRNSYQQLRVFEVDHPATQQWKRELLAESALQHPDGLSYVPVDFENQSLGAELTGAGFDAMAPALFSWLGVVPYLSLDGFRSTALYIAARTVGSALVMDYEQPRTALPEVQRLERDSRSYRAKLSGEEFKLFFTPAQIAAELKAFRNLEDVGTEELNARYFAGRADSLRLKGEAPRLISVWV